MCPQAGADGSQSQVRKLAGLSTIDWNYDQHAVVATLTLDQVLLPWIMDASSYSSLEYHTKSYCLAKISTNWPDSSIAGNVMPIKSCD